MTTKNKKKKTLLFPIFKRGSDTGERIIITGMAQYEMVKEDNDGIEHYELKEDCHDNT